MISKNRPHGDRYIGGGAIAKWDFFSHTSTDAERALKIPELQAYCVSIASFAVPEIWKLTRNFQTRFLAPTATSWTPELVAQVFKIAICRYLVGRGYDRQSQPPSIIGVDDSGRAYRWSPERWDTQSRSNPPNPAALRSWR